MSKQHNPPDHPQKRQHTEQHPLRAKRQRVDCRSAALYLSLFWDGLSKIWLTKYALSEFDRRSSRAVPQSTPRQVRPAHRPVTRKFLTDSRNGLQRKQTADEILQDCNPERLKTIKRVARNGGIDISDLRGVRIMM